MKDQSNSKTDKTVVSPLRSLGKVSHWTCEPTPLLSWEEPRVRGPLYDYTVLHWKQRLQSEGVSYLLASFRESGFMAT